MRHSCRQPRAGSTHSRQAAWQQQQQAQAQRQEEEEARHNQTLQGGHASGAGLAQTLSGRWWQQQPLTAGGAAEAGGRGGRQRRAAASMSAPRPGQVLQLYRAILQAAKRYPSIKRDSVVQEIKREFHAHKVAGGVGRRGVLGGVLAGRAGGACVAGGV